MEKILEVGTKVIIRDLGECELATGICFNDSMARLGGKETVITEVASEDSKHGVLYRLRADGGDWFWNKKMFDVVPEVKESPAKITLKKEGIMVYLTIDNTTIAFHKDAPIGIAQCHPEDEFHPETGRALALYRFMENATLAGLL